MRTVHANQANKTIRDLLPEKLVLPFFTSRTTIMTLSLEQPSNFTIESLMTKYDITLVTINKLIYIYDKLSKTSFTTTERVNAVKTVTSERTLLSKLTDGSSHLKLYPNVNFNSQ